MSRVREDIKEEDLEFIIRVLNRSGLRNLILAVTETCRASAEAKRKHLGDSQDTFLFEKATERLDKLVIELEEDAILAGIVENNNESQV